VLLGEKIASSSGLSFAAFSAVNISLPRTALLTTPPGNSSFNRSSAAAKTAMKSLAVPVLILIVAGIWFQTGGFRDEISVYSEIIRLNPSDVTAYLGRAKDYEDRRDYYKAISDYNEAIRLNPKDNDVYLRRGKNYQALKNYDKAISDFTEAIRLHPNDAFGYLYRGDAYFDERDYDKAISDYSQGITLDPKYALPYYSRGTVYRVLGKNAQAQADFDKAKQLGYTGPQ
jgi:tetratricopeptide (TPR) repeat protein